VRWTNRLEDHLFLDPYKEPPELWIFHWATFLEDFSDPQSPDFKLFPEGLHQETRDTLVLLMPYLDSRSYFGLRKKQMLQPMPKVCHPYKLMLQRSK
jgi:hypothetical protein